MTAYYNEINPYCVEWLQRLIKGKHIAEGIVDSTPIEYVNPISLKSFTQVHLFAGLGGWSYGARLAGWPDDQQLWTASTPCQPFSHMGSSKGFTDERDLWPETYRFIKECQPPVVFGEQVKAAIRHGWLDRLINDFEAIDYAVAAGLLPASAIGAPHQRERLWFVADSEWDKQPRKEPYRRKTRRVGWKPQPIPWDRHWMAALTEFRTVDYGFSAALGATDAARNAIVPQVAALFMSSYLDTQE